MTKMMATHFTEVRNTSKLDSRTSANVKEYESELREIKSEKETLEIFSKKKVNRLMNEVIVSLSHSMRGNISLGWKRRLGVVSGNSMAGIILKKIINSKAKM